MLPNKQQLDALRRKYPAVTKIILHRMNDPYPVPPGTVGEVQHVDDGGNIHMGLAERQNAVADRGCGRFFKGHWERKIIEILFPL